MSNLYSELEELTQKIENNTAKVSDYQRYEYLLQEGGLSHDYIYSYLDRAGFNSWQDLIEARKNKERKETMNAVAVGGLVGLGIGLLLAGIFGGNKK
jgi:hypothetical protein